MSLANITAVRLRAPRSIASLGILVVAFLLAFGLIAKRHGFDLKLTPDSVEYRVISEMPPNLTDALSASRTPVYPAVLRMTRATGGDYSLLPYVQFFLYLFSAIVLFFSAQMSGFKPWEALLASGPLAVSGIMWEYSSQMMTEVVTVAASIVAAAITLLISSRGPTISRNILLAAAVVAASLTRPAFLFLALTCPLAIFLVSPGLRADATLRRLSSEFARNLLFTMAPLLGYALLRLAVVGQFGVVSFGGVPLAGLGTNPAMLKVATVPSLPSAEMRGLARAILARRQTIARAAENRGAPYVYDENSIEHEPTLEALFNSFDHSALVVAVPAARSYYHSSSADVLNPDWIRINKKLRDLSWATIKLRKGLYLKYIVLSYRHSFQSLFEYEDAAIIPIAMTFVAIVLGLIRRGWVGGVTNENVRIGLIALAGVILVVSPRSIFFLSSSAAGTKWRLPGIVYSLFACFACAAITVSIFWSRLVKRKSLEVSETQRAIVFCTIALFFFASGMLLVSFVELPQRRYILAVSPLLPGAILLVSVKWAASAWGKTKVTDAPIRAVSSVSSSSVRL